MKEKSLKTRKELTDYVEETFGCIVCMVGFQISRLFITTHAWRSWVKSSSPLISPHLHDCRTLSTCLWQPPVPTTSACLVWREALMLRLSHALLAGRLDSAFTSSFVHICAFTPTLPLLYIITLFPQRGVAQGPCQGKQCEQKSKSCPQQDLPWLQSWPLN